MLRYPSWLETISLALLHVCSFVEQISRFYYVGLFLSFLLLLKVLHMEYYAFRGFGFDIFTLQIPSSNESFHSCSVSCSFLFLSQILTITCHLCDDIFESANV